MLYFPRGRVISKPSVCATGNDNKSEFLLSRTLIFRDRKTENVIKREICLNLSCFKMFVFPCSANFINLDDRS